MLGLHGCNHESPGMAASDGIAQKPGQRGVPVGDMLSLATCKRSHHAAKSGEAEIDVGSFSQLLAVDSILSGPLAPGQVHNVQSSFSPFRSCGIWLPADMNRSHSVAAAGAWIEGSTADDSSGRTLQQPLADLLREVMHTTRPSCQPTHNHMLVSELGGVVCASRCQLFPLTSQHAHFRIGEKVMDSFVVHLQKTELQQRTIFRACRRLKKLLQAVCDSESQATLRQRGWISKHGIGLARPSLPIGKQAGVFAAQDAAHQRGLDAAPHIHLICPVVENPIEHE
mmetsp:Transcript_53940/g.126547  ORF Transcript_53940/g.126547 Transcript_53940/m.126547 type:complete len:283 (+) Transcript_53940:868-1716(+)